MPKISKTRIINLKYNDNKRCISNQIFDYQQGQNALFAMDNGVGKTVLIQFFMQPFLSSNKYRKLAGRPFEDYFVDNSPTFIMHEMLLDNSEKLLIGLIIRKETSLDNDDKLRIHAFTNKYTYSDDFDIENIPFIKDKTIIKHSDAVTLIKEYSREHYNFEYYNFSDYSRKKMYFEQLLQNNIDSNEWEKIIRSINNDESGLSNLYDQYKTDEALIKGVIIPLIEEKLKDDEYKIEALKSNLDKYINSYKSSYDSIENLEIYEKFLNDINEVLEILAAGELSLLEKKQLFNSLNYAAHNIDSKLELAISNKEEIEQKLNDLSCCIKLIQHEKESKKYYDIENSINELKDNILLKDAAKNACNNNLEIYICEKYNLKLALEKQYLDDVVIKLNEVIERIDVYTKSDSEVAVNINNYKYNLIVYVKNIIKNLEVEIKNINEKFKESEAEIQRQNVELNQLDIKINKENQNKGSATAKINYFSNVKDTFVKKHPKFNYSMNLLNEYLKEDLEDFRTKNIQNISNINLMIEENSLDIENESKKNLELFKKKSINNDLIIEKNNALGSIKQELGVFNKTSAVIIDILNKVGLSNDIYENKDKASVILNGNIIRLENIIKNNENKISSNLEKIEFYQTGIKLPIEVINSLDELGIEYQYGLKFLQNYQGKSYEIKKILSDNPFFAFSLILESKDIMKLETERLDILTSILIPIIDRDELDSNIKYTRSSDVLTIVNQKFLSAFNPMLVNKRELNNIIESLKNKILALEEENINTVNYLEVNRDEFSCLNNYPYLGNEYLELEKNINLISNDIETLNQASLKISEDIKINNQLMIDLNAYKNELGNLLKDANYLQNDYLQFVEIYEVYIKDKNNLKKTEDKIKEYGLTKNSLKESIERLNDYHVKIKNLLNGNDKKLSDYRKELTSYGEVNSGEALDLSYLELKGKLNALEEKLKQDIQRDQKEKESLIIEKEKYLQNIRNLKKEGDILDDEYLKITFSQDALDDTIDKINEYTKALKLLTDEVQNLSVAKVKKESDLSHRLEKIIENGFDCPLEKGLIKGDFENRIKNEKQSYNSYNVNLQAVNKSIKNFELISYQLVDYKQDKVIDSSVIFDYDNDLDLLEKIKVIKDSHKKIVDDIQKKEDKLKHIVDDLTTKYRDVTIIHGSLNKYRYKDDKLNNKLDVFTLIEIVKRTHATIKLSLQTLNDEEDSVIKEILRYTDNCLTELKSVDKNSSIKIFEKTQKLLNIDIPEAIEEQTLRDYLKEIIIYASKQDDYKDYLNDSLTTYHLLDKFVGRLSRVKVYIHKIETTYLVKKTWQQTLSQNSGGEKFVSMFMLLSSFMSYVRRSNLYVGKNELSKVIIMDNPFAKTNAQHLLVPLFKIAETYKTQIIALSGIGGSPVYNRFNVIYVSKVVVNKYNNNESVAFVNKQESLEYSDFNYKRNLLD